LLLLRGLLLRLATAAAAGALASCAAAFCPKAPPAPFAERGQDRLARLGQTRSLAILDGGSNDCLHEYFLDRPTKKKAPAWTLSWFAFVREAVKALNVLQPPMQHVVFILFFAVLHAEVRSIGDKKPPSLAARHGCLTVDHPPYNVQIGLVIDLV
jgi:hypothetical protein